MTWLSWIELANDTSIIFYQLYRFDSGLSIKVMGEHRSKVHWILPLASDSQTNTIPKLKQSRHVKTFCQKQSWTLPALPHKSATCAEQKNIHHATSVAPPFPSTVSILAPQGFIWKEFPPPIFRCLKKHLATSITMPYNGRTTGQDRTSIA